MSTTQPRRPTLKDLGLDAAWLAARIEESPILLDLTDGMPKFERTVPRTGPDQFAVLLFDPADGTRFIVEVQLGAADTDQLTRALALWEAERTRLPVAHRVVVAAEHIPADVAHAAALAQATAPVGLLELHAEKTGNIVIVHGEPVPLPGPDAPIAPGP
ncbi:hypothetical protein SA2016_0730 [Sinomonas atrocyanea]|uniref:Uncharacterized protein n=1 Tax=Sinomonas atrocyanea TaxID=37927 RepID=A0A126ZW84_9MICC|nr:hypothetical protein [Sinomonas atrocyanea]AMM31420.1 hypothetical protein SA2016_0730 [Sinomonas atrocyanea]GEB63705.1 hypothetical protein SAT01_11530 [Sinomonas atrocyanea]GGG81090.1 hypothetical protein GCM10007172_38110 [Sinomonas atrocyanea]